MKVPGLTAQWLIFYIKDLIYVKIYINGSIAGLKQNTSEASYSNLFLPQNCFRYMSQ